MSQLKSVAYEHIKKMILEDKFVYGKIYSETTLSKEIGVSRTPMRDAIHRLVQEKYLDTIPSKGITLHQLTSDDVISTFQVRSAIEGYCTLQITRQYNSDAARELFTNLKQSISRQKKIIETTHSIEDFVVLDNQFHLAIVAFAQNQSFNEIFTSYIYQIRRLAMLSLQHEGRMEDTFREHENIVNAMMNGDSEHIYDITLTHMDAPKGLNLADL